MKRYSLEEGLKYDRKCIYSDQRQFYLYTLTDGFRIEMATNPDKTLRFEYEKPRYFLVMTGYEDYVLDRYRWNLDVKGKVTSIDDLPNDSCSRR